MAGTFAGVSAVAAQSIQDVSTPHVSWTTEVAGALLVQPASGGGTGDAVAVTLARSTPRATWSPAILIVAGRVPVIDSPGRNGYMMDRDWVITAIGADAFIRHTERLVVSLGAKGGVLWNYDRLKVVGEHPFGPDGPTRWEQKAGLIMDAGARYRIGEHVSLASRLGMVQHIFADDFFGITGVLASLGVALNW